MPQDLPPHLLALFAPRDPINYLPPLDKLPHEKKRHNYTGIANVITEFENPADTPDPVKVETREEKKERKRREKAEQAAYKLEQDIALWSPHSNPNATTDPKKTIFVARLNYDTSESKLRREFEEFGSIRKIVLIHNKLTGKPRGYAFVEYDHERNMQEAYRRLDGKKIDGRRIIVDIERGRTQEEWLPRRLGGGLGGTRRGGPDENVKHSGRDDGRFEDRDRDRDYGGRERRRSRSRSAGRERVRRRGSRERRRERDRGDTGGRRRRSRSKERERRDRGDREEVERPERRERDRDRDRGDDGERGDRRERDRGERGGRDRGGDADPLEMGPDLEAEQTYGGGEETDGRRRDRKRSRSREKDRERKRRRSRSRSREKRRDSRRERHRERDRNRTNGSERGGLEDETLKQESMDSNDNGNDRSGAGGDSEPYFKSEYFPTKYDYNGVDEEN